MKLCRVHVGSVAPVKIAELPIKDGGVPFVSFDVENVGLV